MVNPYKLHLSKYSTHKIFIDNLGRGNKILDVGCNDGYIGAHSDKTNSFYGLDYSEKSIKKTKRIYKGAIVYNLNSVTTLPWKIKFDLILFGDVLEHLIYPEKVLSFFVKKYLKKGGTAIVALPNIVNWQIRIKLLLGIFDYTQTGILDKTHLHFYTFKTARKLVKTIGLKIKNEIGGSSVFGGVINLFPFSKSLLSNNIVLICEK